MTIPTIFDVCKPRPDVLASKVAATDFAADLAQVIRGEGANDYVDSARFFANTYPTRGLKNLLENVCARLSGQGDAVASIFRLDTSYGGGKSHSLIALCHAAREGADVAGIGEFVEPGVLLPKGRVRVAAFDGENADPVNGRQMPAGHLAFTPWGEIASALGGKDGYERVRKSDEVRVAPGAETIKELFGGEPTLILLDELSVYLRKANKRSKGDDQLTAFLTSLIKAVGGTDNAALVFTLAVGKEGSAVDAYKGENERIAQIMAELESVSARTATLLNPTEEDETVQVLRRRLFESIDDDAMAVVAAYRAGWLVRSDSLPEDVTRPETFERFRASYPLHPEVLDTLIQKTSTLGNFQRVRGMLRLLARTVAHLWEQRPGDATAIHLHHLNLGHEPIRQEIVTRLEQAPFAPAISSDISSGAGDNPALAEEIDARHHSDMPPYASYVARTVFMHSLAFNERLQGISSGELRYSMLGPAMDISFIEQARVKFVAESAYLDDRPGSPMRFQAEANLNQIIRRSEEHVDAEQARVELNDRIREVFSGSTFNAIPFPGGPYDVPDDVADGRPRLVVLGFEAVCIKSSVEAVPDLIQRIFARKGAEDSVLRKLRNNLVFLIAEEARIDDMRRAARRRLALQDMMKPDRLNMLAEHQKADVREREERSRQELALAIAQCYRHVFYPSPNRIGTNPVDLAHTAIEIHSASESPGKGQQHIERTLRDLNKLRSSEDEPDSPAYVRDRTWLKTRGQMSTASLREEFRRDPRLPMLLGDDIFRRGVMRGIEQGEYLYQCGELLCGPGDPMTGIRIDEESMIFTMAYAQEKDIWPRQPPDAEKPPDAPGVRDGDFGQPDAAPEQEPDEPERDAFSAEAVLREAFVRLWEQVRKNRVDSVARLTVRLFEHDDAFKLLSPVGTVAGAKKTVILKGSYGTHDGGEFGFEFEGPVSDAEPVREFLQLQFRAAKWARFEATFTLMFEGGLSMQGDAAEKLTERLSRFVSASAEVTATPRVG